MRIVSESISIDELRSSASVLFGNLVKAVVDVRRRIIAIEAEMHSDLESLLIQNGSSQNDLWGINMYPDEPDDDFIEFDSMINVRPSQGNRSRGVEDEHLRSLIAQIVAERIVR